MNEKNFVKDPSTKRSIDLMWLNKEVVKRKETQLKGEGMVVCVCFCRKRRVHGTKRRL